MEAKQVVEITNSIYEHVDGWEISSKAINKFAIVYRGLKYDEAYTESFLHALISTEPQKEDIFLDLGSGLGKKVLAAALFYKFNQCVGIEMIEDLYTAANSILYKYCPYFSELEKTRYIFGNYHNIDISFASIIHVSISPTVIEFDLKGELGKKLKQLKKGSRLIISEVPVSFLEFSLINEMEYIFPSRVEKVFVYKKIE